MRTEWVAKRKDDPIRTQMYYARKGLVTEEMAFVAAARIYRRKRFAPKSRAAA